MGRARWTIAASLVAIAAFAAPNAFGGLVLPDSSHYQGSLIDGDVLIEFAVYDTEDGNEFANAGYDAPGEGRYTYVYRLWVDSGAGDFDLTSFEIYEIGQGAIDNQEQIGSVDDEADGIAPADEYFNDSMTVGTWEFADGMLIMDEHSAFLVISSDNDLKAGSYAINHESDFPVPGGDNGNEVPEPMTLALLAAGGLGLLSRRKVQS